MPLKGQKMSEEHKRKLSEANKGKHAHLIGREVSEETKAKIAAANSRNKKGTKLSAETRAKMSEAHKAQMASLTPEERVARGAKISAAIRAKPHIYTEEQKKKMSEANKRYFASLTEEEQQQRTRPWIEALRQASLTKTTDTSIEIFVAEFLRQVGIEFIHPYKVGKFFEADFYIPVTNTILEVNGCYWHCCEKCGFNEGIPDKSAEQKRLSDKRRYGYFAKQGYKVSVIWEHDIKQNIFDRLINLT